jgi:hypothetical protein
MDLARGYPRDWLVPLARELARRCRLAADGAELVPAIDVAEEPLPNSTGFVDLLEQPDDSRIAAERTSGGLKLELPRPAFGRRQAVLTVVGDRLRVEQGKLDGTRQQASTAKAPTRFRSTSSHTRARANASA